MAAVSPSALTDQHSKHDFSRAFNSSRSSLLMLTRLHLYSASAPPSTSSRLHCTSVLATKASHTFSYTAYAQTCTELNHIAAPDLNVQVSLGEFVEIYSNEEDNKGNNKPWIMQVTELFQDVKVQYITFIIHHESDLAHRLYDTTPVQKKLSMFLASVNCLLCIQPSG